MLVLRLVVHSLRSAPKPILPMVGARFDTDNGYSATATTTVLCSAYLACTEALPTKFKRTRAAPRAHATGTLFRVTFYVCASPAEFCAV